MPATVSERFGSATDGDTEVVADKPQYDEYVGVYDRQTFKAFFADKSTPEPDVLILCYDDVDGKRINPRGVRITYFNPSADFTEAIDEFNGSFCFADLYPHIDLHYFTDADAAQTEAREWFVLKSRSIPAYIDRRYTLIGDAKFNADEMAVVDSTDRVLFNVSPIEYTDIPARQVVIASDSTGFTLRTYFDANDAEAWGDKSAGVLWLGGSWEGTGVYLVDAADVSGTSIRTQDRTNWTAVQADVGNTYLTVSGSAFTTQGSINLITIGGASAGGAAFTMLGTETLNFDAGTSLMNQSGTIGLTTLQGKITSTTSKQFYINCSNTLTCTSLVIDIASTSAATFFITGAGKTYTFTDCTISNPTNVSGGYFNCANIATGTLTITGGSTAYNSAASVSFIDASNASSALTITVRNHVVTYVTGSTYFLRTLGTSCANVCLFDNCTIPPNFTSNTFYLKADASVSLYNTTWSGIGTQVTYYNILTGLTTNGKLVVGNRVTLTVTDGTDPVAGATVTVTNATDSTTIFTGTTDANGNISDGGNTYLSIPAYRHTSTAIGGVSCYVTVSKTGYTTRTAVYLDVDAVSSTQTIALTAEVAAPNRFRFDGSVFGE